MVNAIGRLPGEGGHVSYNVNAAHVPMLAYVVSFWRSLYEIQYDAWKGILPRCNHLDGPYISNALIEKNSNI